MRLIIETEDLDSAFALLSRLRGVTRRNGEGEEQGGIPGRAACRRPGQHGGQVSDKKPGGRSA